MNDIIDMDRVRLRRLIDAELAELRSAGGRVTVQRDVGDALLVDVVSGRGEHRSLWIDPTERYAHVRKLLEEINTRVAASGRTNAILGLDPASAALLNAFADKIEALDADPDAA